MCLSALNNIDTSFTHASYNANWHTTTIEKKAAKQMHVTASSVRALLLAQTHLHIGSGR